MWQGCNVNSCSGTDGERRKGSGRESGRSLFSLTLLRQTMEEGEEDQRHTQDGGRLMQSDRNGRRIKGWNQKREKDERVQTRVLRTIERGTEMPKERNRYSDTQVQGCTCLHTHTCVQGEMCVCMHAHIHSEGERKKRREREGKCKEKHSRKEQEPFLVTLIVTFNLRKESKPTSFSSLLKLVMHPELQLNGRMEDALQGAMVSHWYPVCGPRIWTHCPGSS